MQIGIISDIHGNFIALETVLKEISKFNLDQYFFLGDALNYYPDCNEVINSLRDNSFKCILGNHENLIINHESINPDKEKFYLTNYTKKKINNNNLNYIKSFPLFIECVINLKKILFVHGSPFDYLNGYIYPDTQIDAFKTLKYDYIFCGHTHRACTLKINNLTICNVGSVGMPRDNGAMASFVIYDTVLNVTTIHRVQLPVKNIISHYSNHVHKDIINLLHRK